MAYAAAEEGLELGAKDREALDQLRGGVNTSDPMAGGKAGAPG